MKTLVGLIVVAVVILGGTYWFSQQRASVATTGYKPAAVMPRPPINTIPVAPVQVGSSTNQATAPHNMNLGAATTTPKPQSFSVQASDTKASPTSISVAKGALVAITFTVDANNTYHGGLEFRSTHGTTGPILPGKSKTITFVATTSFVLTPYWPATNTKKPYAINVVVK